MINRIKRYFMYHFKCDAWIACAKTLDKAGKNAAKPI